MRSSAVGESRRNHSNNAVTLHYTINLFINTHTYTHKQAHVHIRTSSFLICLVCIEVTNIRARPNKYGGNHGNNNREIIIKPN